MSGFLGKYKIAVDTTDITQGDSLAAYLTTAGGELITSTLLGGKQRVDVMTSAEYAEDSAHVSGDSGQFVLGVRNDANAVLTNADGDYTPLATDSAGRLKVVADLSATFDFVYDEDSAAASGAPGASVLLVRQDTLAASTSTDGDYGQFKSNNLGELYVFDTTTHTSLASILSEIQSITYAEDSASASADPGVFLLGVRNDANAVVTSADGDYSQLSVDSAGRLKTVSSSVSNFEYAEDSVHTSGHIGAFTLAVRSDANGSLVSASGDYAAMLTNEVGDIKVNDRMNGTSLQQRVTLALANVAQPLPAVALAGRKHVVMQNISDKDIYLGSATVAATGATTGLLVPKSGFWEGDIGPANVVYGVCATAAKDVVVWEIS